MHRRSSSGRRAETPLIFYSRTIRVWSKVASTTTEKPKAMPMRKLPPRFFGGMIRQGSTIARTVRSIHAGLQEGQEKTVRMMQPNLERMLSLIDEVFATRNDPAQLNVDDAVMERLVRIHPATISELADERGPYVWILLLPTTQELMNRFLNKEITEQQLFEETPQGIKYDALYLCSALVLPEYRRKGLAGQVALQAVQAILRDHPIQSLFTWAFSEAGNKGSEKLAAALGLPLRKLSR